MSDPCADLIGQQVRIVRTYGEVRVVERTARRIVAVERYSMAEKGARLPIAVLDNGWRAYLHELKLTS